MILYDALIAEAEMAHQAKDWPVASKLWQKAVMTRPDDWRGIYGLASAYAETDSDDAAALVMLTRAVELSGGSPEPLTALGAVLRRSQNVGAARWCYEQALKKAPELAILLTGMAGSYVNQGDPHAGIPYARKAVAIEGPHRVHAANDLALLLLEAGQWAEGWRWYAERVKLPGYHARDYSGVPQWDGGPVKTLALHAEQGLGDEILFAACMEHVQADRILLECSPRLVPLFRRSFDVECFGTHDELVKAARPDAWFRLADLIPMFRPEPKPKRRHLYPDPERARAYRGRLRQTGGGPYIGFAWHGGTERTHERIRNAPLEHWKRLAGCAPGVKVSLQYGPRAQQADDLGLIHWQSAIDDLDEFASLTSALDLVISCPQTAVHFAGGLGVRCWVPQSSKPSWQFQTDGPMPWYESVALYRQKGEDWTPVFAAMESALADL